MSNKPHKLARNEDTGEIYEATPDDIWIEKLTAWRAAMAVYNHDVRLCPVPSPIPAGHIMFLQSTKRRPSLYKPADNWLRVTVIITEEDLIKGREPTAVRNPCYCPIARAFLRQFPNSAPYVNADGINYSTPGNSNVDIPMTDAAIEWMDAYDDGRPVQPGPLVVIDGPYDADNSRPVGRDQQIAPGSAAGSL
jgi:hypothetical protein